MASTLFKSLHYGNPDIATRPSSSVARVALAGTSLATAVVKRFGLMPTLFVGTVFASTFHPAPAYSPGMVANTAVGSFGFSPWPSARTTLTPSC